MLIFFNYMVVSFVVVVVCFFTCFKLDSEQPLSNRSESCVTFMCMSTQTSTDVHKAL